MTQTAQDALMHQMATVQAAIDKLQDELARVHDAVDPENVSWRDVAMLAATVDAVRRAWSSTELAA